MVRSLLVCLFVAAVALPVAADVAKGLDAFRKGDYATAQAIWEPLAKSGDAAAQFNLGILYRRGLGVEPDNRQAMSWFERAAGRGHPTAQFNLGLIYERGIGVQRNRTAALRWYRRAAKSDPKNDKFRPARARAQYHLSKLLLSGNSANRPAGMFWMQQSASSGYDEAQFQLGLGYAAGRDLPRDPVQAAQWFERAAIQGHAAAQTNLATLYETGTGVPRSARKAAGWYRKAAEQNISVAQINLGSLYAQGRGVPRDDSEALKWYRLAAQSDTPEAHYNLGVLYEKSPELADPRSAYFWYAVASRSGHRKSVLRLVVLRKQIDAQDVKDIERRAAAWRPEKPKDGENNPSN